jgi:Flp pilus assembly protein TadD
MAQIEALLADDPDDAFLRYGLAMEHASAGDDAACAAVLRDLIERTAARPYVPAFLQCGQALARLDRPAEACEVLNRGIEAARTAGDTHAMGEMQGLLAGLE